MGFLIVKVMREFSMSLRDVLDMPKRHFFWLVHEIDRQRAALDIRQYQVLCAVNSSEAAEAVVDGLKRELGEPLKFGRYIAPAVSVNLNDDELDPEFDRQALHALKAKMGM